MTAIRTTIGVFVLSLPFLLPVSLWAQSEQQDANEPVLLAWKYADGQTVDYVYDEEKVIRETGRVSAAEFRARQRIEYQWSVLFRTETFAAIGVTFQRVQLEAQTPTGMIAVDTDAPIDPRHSDPAALALQDEAFRIQQARFVFFGVATGGIAWPEQVAPTASLPNSFRTPKTTKYFVPETFGSGDAVALPAEPVQIGDEWTTSIVSLVPGQGAGRYRLSGRAHRLGHECWKIEGLTTYQRSGATGGQSAIGRASSGERVSQAYFDAEAGLLVLSEETTTVETSLDKETIRQAVFKVTRSLRDPDADERAAVVTRQIAGGQTAEFRFLAGLPEQVRKDWVQVTAAGMGLGMDERTDQPPLATHVNWMLGLNVADRRVRSIALFEVSGDVPVPIEYEDVSEADADVHVLLFGLQELASPRAQWFFDDTTSERIIKVVVESDQGERIELHQMIFVQTLASRTMDNVVYAERPTRSRWD